MRLRLDLIFTEKVCKVAALAWAEMLQNNGGDLLRDKIKTTCRQSMVVRRH